MPYILNQAKTVRNLRLYPNAATAARISWGMDFVVADAGDGGAVDTLLSRGDARSEEHTSELQSRGHLVCRLLLEKKNSLYGDLGECFSFFASRSDDRCRRIVLHMCDGRA